VRISDKSLTALLDGNNPAEGQGATVKKSRLQASRSFLSFTDCLLEFFNSLSYLPLMFSRFGEVFYSCRNSLLAWLVGRAKS
jgi:hypothetical protein